MKYTEKDLVQIAKRENNTKRSYLVVDPLQGKHVPVAPSQALDLFQALAEQIREIYQEERLLLVGFAETATAIGAQVAILLGAKYIQTTREVIPNVNYLYFSEEHSHATEQKLVKEDMDSVVEEIDRIIFIEDEVTTGNTILHIIRILNENYPKQCKYAVASLLNGMSEAHMETYQRQDIPLHYLVKTDHSIYGEKAMAFVGDGKTYDCRDAQDVSNNMNIVDISHKMDARRLVSTQAYVHACEQLWEGIAAAIGSISNKRVLVLGTEEFMFPALYVGNKIEKKGNAVYYHATTRSPITVSKEKAYPLHCRFILNSLYDSGRKTFLYDIDTYDKVLVITDAERPEQEGLPSLLYAVSQYNQDITVIRWC